MSEIHTPTDQVQTLCLAAGSLATGASGSIDTEGFGRMKAVVLAATAAASTLDVSFEESADDGVSDPWTAVTGSAIAQIPATQTNAVRLLSVDLATRKRHLRAQMVATGTVSGSVSAELYNPCRAPVIQPFPATVVP